MGDVFNRPGVAGAVLHMSRGTCHVSPVIGHMLSFLFLFFICPLKIGQRGGASWWRVCYQWDLPRLFF